METIGTSFAEDVLQAHADIRYAAMLRDGQLLLRERAGLHDASSSESDKYEELIVNPTLLTLVGRRGDIDCGGAQFVLIRYGHFFQFVAPMPGGRISIGMEPDNLATYVHIWIARRSLWSAPAAPMGSAIGPGDGEKHEKTSPSAHLGDTCSAILLSRRFLQRHPQRLAC